MTVVAATCVRAADFLQLKKNHGMEEARARDLFYALWVSDLFMQRVESNGTWSLFCPNEAPGLSDCWGEEFNNLYMRYEAEGRQRETIDAQKLWFAIIESQIETGTPYILYKVRVQMQVRVPHMCCLMCGSRVVDLHQDSSLVCLCVCFSAVCCLIAIRTRATPRATTSTLAPSSPPICARRSWSTRRPTRSLCATSPPCPCPCS